MPPLSRSLLAAAFCLVAPAAFAAAPPANPPASGAAASAAAQAMQKPSAAAQTPKAAKATPVQRAEAERLDPLARAAFWAREVDIDPRDADARLRLARALRALGRNEQAAATTAQLLVIQPDNVEALMESARDDIAQDQGFYAIEPAQHAASLAPHDWRPLSLLGIALEQASRDDEALAAHQKALALAPNNPATLTNLGMYYAAHGDAARAETLLRQAAAAPGATAQERQNLALVLGLEGRLADAERLEREDLPPPVVESNLAYLKAATSPAAPAPDRTWDSLKSAQ